MASLLNLKNFNRSLPEHYGELLATQKIDASQGKLFGGTNVAVRIPVQTRDVIVLIGLGGTGIRTLDYIKGKLERRLAPGWTANVVFLGIDADANEVSRAANIKESECIILSDPDIADKLLGKKTAPVAWNAISNKTLRENLALQGPEQNGSGRMRLLGKYKIHNWIAGHPSYDAQIVDRLKRLTMAPGVNRPTGFYQIFILGSGNGGTSSGGFCELPAMVHHAFENNPHRINSMLFLPDTMTADPEIAVNTQILEANGFATLKELEFYMGLDMRLGYELITPLNDSSENNRIVLDGGTPFIDAPYLIGTNGGPAADSGKRAQETVAEFLISILGQHQAVGNNTPFPVDSFQSNASAESATRPALDSFGNLQMGERANTTRSYGAIGFAESSTPNQLMQAYSVSLACDKMKIKSLPRVEWTSQVNQAGAFGQNSQFYPFKGPDYMWDPIAGTQEAQTIVAPLEEALTNVIYNARVSMTDFKFPGDLKPRYSSITWETVVEGKLYAGKKRLPEAEKQIFQDHTNATARKNMESDLANAFKQYRNNVQEFVKLHGPFAFVNLYEGRFSSDNGATGIGIRTMIERISDGCDIHNNAHVHTTVTEADNALKKHQNEMLDPGWFKNLLGPLLRKQRDASALKWAHYWEKLQEAKINEERGRMAITQGTILRSAFLDKANELRNALEIFGYILDSMAGAYKELSKPVLDFNEFRRVGDNTSEANLAAVNNQTYRWLRDQVDAQVNALPAEQSRNDLVSNFFAKTEAWLQVDDTFVTEDPNTNKCHLVKPDVAIPARQMFDAFMNSIVPYNVQIDIESLFAQMAPDPAARDAYAAAIIHDLAEKGKPLFNGVCNQNNYLRSIMYPAKLLTGTNGGPAIAQALVNAANNEFNDTNIKVLASAETDSIRMYQYVGSIELYRLKELNSWERSYEARLKIDPFQSFMHGYTASLEEQKNDRGQSDYMEYRSWIDYPSPCVYPDDARRYVDPNFGDITREGKRQKRIDNLIQKARNLGILYAVCENDSWSIKRAKPEQSWELEINSLKKVGGCYPVGVELIREMAEQNQSLDSNDPPVTLESISCDVRLARAGHLSGGARTEEIAWRYAAMVLYTHIPMLDEIEKTVGWFESRTEQIRNLNRAQLLLQMPGYYSYLLQSGLFYEQDNCWYIRVKNGSRMVVNMDPMVQSILPAKDQKLIKDGMTHAYIYKTMRNNKYMSDDLYLDLAAEAKTQYDNLREQINMGDKDAQDELFKIWIPRSKTLENEMDLVCTEFGANFGLNPEDPVVAPIAVTKSFCQKLNSYGFSDNEAQEIYDFYRIAKKWKSMKNPREQ